MVVVNVYAPNNPLERKRFFQDLYETLMTTRPTILEADFNSIASCTIDKIGGNMERGTDSRELSALLSDHQLSDAFRLSVARYFQKACHGDLCALGEDGKLSLPF